MSNRAAARVCVNSQWLFLRQNIVVTAKGEWKLAGFGCCARLGSEAMVECPYFVNARAGE